MTSLEKDPSLYEEIVNLPFNYSRSSYEDIFEKAKNCNLVSKEVKDYLVGLNQTREKWAYAFKKSEHIIGIQTTSRIESLHSSMKRLVRTKCSLKEMILRLIQFTYQINTLKDTEDNIIQDSLVDILSKNIVLSQIQENYTSYTYNKCLIQFFQASNLKATKLK